MLRPQEHFNTRLLDNFNKALPHIRAALKHCGDTHKPAHVWAMLVARECELYVNENSAVVTQILKMPNGDQLHFWLAGGNLSEIKKLEQDIIDQAKKNGIKRVSLVGRAGWLKELSGYKDAGRILVKEL